MYQHAINGENDATTVKDVPIKIPYEETVVEQYIKGYRCSCGSIK